ncbi:MAG: HAD-IA family hydrolase [bacterium]
MNSKKLIIFDLDGTLVDSCRDLATAVNLMRAHYNLPALALEDIRGYVGNGVRMLVTRALQGTTVDVNEALQVQIPLYRAHAVDQTTLYPGVLECLKQLRERGDILAVATNKPAESCDIILKHLGIYDWFISVLAADRFPVLKPAPDMITHIMTLAGVTPENTWVVGDNFTDLEAARRAGVSSIFVTYGYGTPGSETPTRQCDAFEAILGVL